MDSAAAAATSAAAPALGQLEGAASSEPCGSSGSTGAAAVPNATDILGNIQKLKEQQKKMKEDRKKIAAMLRNEERRRNRIRKRARQLSDGDLLSLIKMRKDTTEAAAASSSASTGTAEPTE